MLVFFASADEEMSEVSWRAWTKVLTVTFSGDQRPRQTAQKQRQDEKVTRSTIDRRQQHSERATTNNSILVEVYHPQRTRRDKSAGIIVDTSFAGGRTVLHD